MKIDYPASLALANLPTRIEKLAAVTSWLQGPEIYLKRDDQTGTELSGNKIRKLEFLLAEAKNKGYDALITCGGLQSNHARTTAAAGAKLGFKTLLILKGSATDSLEGNYLLDNLLGAEARLVTAGDYNLRLDELFAAGAKELERRGFRPYSIPEGASNGLGSCGYVKAFEEILEQEKALGFNFDSLVLAAGSGGTYGGLLAGNYLRGRDLPVYGINVYREGEAMVARVRQALGDLAGVLQRDLPLAELPLKLIDGYVGKGYGLSRPEELQVIKKVAELEGIVFDPVYTGKAFYGLIEEIKKGRFTKRQKILFIHTGGIFGLFGASFLKKKLNS